jgi:membrane protein DedA with SNARE-associated domain
MDLIKFIVLSLAGAAISTAVLALIARPLASAVRHALHSDRETSRAYTTVSTVR